MNKNILTSILCCVVTGILTFSAYSQEKIYLIKDNRIVATYGLDDVDYLSFELPDNIVSDDFEITVDEVDYTEVLWTVTPSDPDMYYYSNVYTQASLDNFGSVDKMAERLYNDMGFLASMAGIDQNTFMAEYVLHKGECQIGYDQLGPGTEALLVVFGCDPDGVATTSDYTALPFATPEMPKIELSVDFDIECDSPEATITFTPSDDTVRYYLGVKELEEGDNIDVQADINNVIWQGNVMGKSPEQVVLERTVVGAVTRTYSLEPETRYIVFAASVTPDGVVNSEVSSEIFTSGSVRPSENTFSLNIDSVTANKVVATVTPSNSDSYSAWFIAASEFEGKTDQEVLEEYVSTNGFRVDYFTATGEHTYEFDVEPGTEYYFFAFGYSNGIITTPMTKISFTTLPPSDPKTWTASFDNLEVDGRKANIDILVNQQDVKYIWNVVDATGTVEQVKEALLRDFERYQGYGLNYVDMSCITGNQRVEFQGIEEGQEYKFFAVVMDAETGECVTDVFFSDTFTNEGIVATPSVSSPLKASLKLLMEKE